ncbi:glycosyltransferase family A protein [Flavobacterium sp.]|uniref:glycosyltransferase family 2 protein n=1 Tax=Flavobacterium sp. TaxID=239 RepID=UPI0026188624|nr:glycosyltransferase family A protein [Flavobacterium sp.]
MLAIIIPYYKLTFFEATLQSLAEQTCQDFKVYIGDDASPEDPTALLEQFQGKFNFIYHRFTTNLGGTSLTKQWERCIALSGNEEWLMILGDDDVLGENVVEAFYENLEEIKQNGCNVVRFATQIIKGGEKAISRIFEHPQFEKATDAFWRKFKGETRSSLSEYVFSRLAYSKYGFLDYPLAWHSDDMACLEFADEHPIFSTNNAQLYIRMSSESISGKVDNLALKKEASSLFYETIVKDYLSSFNKKQRLKLIAKLEQHYFEKKQKILFFKIVKYHLKYTTLLDLVKFFRRIYINK